MRRRRPERPLTNADERAIDRRIADHRRASDAEQRRNDEHFHAWVRAERAKLTPADLAQADAAHDASTAQDHADRLERQRHDEARKLERWRSN